MIAALHSVAFSSPGGNGCFAGWRYTPLMSLAFPSRWVATLLPNLGRCRLLSGAGGGAGSCSVDGAVAPSRPGLPPAPEETPLLPSWLPGRLRLSLQGGPPGVQAAPLPGFPKEAQLATATISLWTVVGAVQAMERAVEVHALQLLSLEQRSGLAEKRFTACEKALAELGSRLESRWAVLGTLLQEYGQLQRRLENMESLLKNWNFWVLRAPVGSSAEAAQGSDVLEETSSHFSHEEWEDLQGWQKELYRNVVEGNCESLISLDFAVSKLESLSCRGEPPCGLAQAASRAPQEPPARNPAEPSAPRTERSSWVQPQDGPCAGKEAQEHSGGTYDYYTVSKLDPLPGDREEDPACTPFQTDLGPQADTVSVGQKPAEDGGLLPIEDHQGEDPANVPLLLLFPGGSVAPICSGTIGESQPLSSLQGACLGSRAGGKDPGSPATGAEATGDRPHSCLECGKTFSLLLSLQIHQMNHQKKKRQEGTCCGFAFGCPSELVRHKTIHPRERPHKCPICGKGFVRKQHLIPHLRLHTGERPYPCAECGKDFTCKHHLLEHQRTHTGERPYACAECGKTFRRKKSLKDHLPTHGPEQGQTDSARDLPDKPQNDTALGGQSARQQKATLPPAPKGGRLAVPARCSKPRTGQREPLGPVVLAGPSGSCSWGFREGRGQR
ncbi:zinc finger protein 783-like [Paroedura picta]|uniref:zinc finger protein 783-like n=1 Tax=Paroedura picta TaxID=143630 RepID=UPI0040560582